jgi:hypothetical protein
VGYTVIYDGYADITQNGATGVGAFFGGIGGALLGLAVGSNSSVDRWEKVLWAEASGAQIGASGNGVSVSAQITF